MKPAPPVTRTRAGVYSAMRKDAVLALHEDAVGLDQRVEGAGVGPAPDADVVLELPALDVSVVDAGDLELAPRRGADAADDVEDLGVVEVEPDHGEARLGVGGLLLDLDDVPLVERGDAVALGI